MSSSHMKLAASAALLMSSSVALAIPFGSFDTRSMAMGGAGVAVGGADAAPLFNPALLSVTKEEDDFALMIPTIGVRVSDPDNLRDSMKAFDDGKYIDKLQTSVDALNTAITGGNQITIQNAANLVTANLRAVSDQLVTLSDKPITADVGVATVVAIPSKTLGTAFYANGTATAGGVFQYRDKDTLDNLITLSLSCATDPVINATDCNNLATYKTTTMASGLHVKGVQLSEIGFAFSHEFNIMEHNVALGITPKIVKSKLYDVMILANSNTTSADDYKAEYSNFNFDLGAAKDYGNGWRTGFVVKNVLPQTLDFKKAPTPGTTPVATGEKLSLRPQARIGASHANSWSTVALDVDLTRNDPAGLESATQYIALGGELDAWGWAQLRAGYRVDMVNSARNVTSVGLGIAPFGVVHIDLAYAGNANEFGASIQLGLHF